MNEIISILRLVHLSGGCIKGTGFLLTVIYLAYVDYTLAVWGFPETPQIIVLAVLVSVSLYANLSRAETVINLSVILIPLIFHFYVFPAVCLERFGVDESFPNRGIDWTEWVKGLLKAQIAFIGIELYLFFRKHVDIKEKIKGFPLFVYQLVWFIILFFLCPY